MRVLSINSYKTYNYNCLHRNSTEQRPETQSSNMLSFSGIKNLSPEKMKELTDLKVFTHHIYEYKKGIRPLFLETVSSEYKQTVSERLKKEKIDYVIHDLDKTKTINIFFGEQPCVEVIKTLNPNLSEHTPKEDFILGVLLGYDKVRQCSRYLDMCKKFKKKPSE